MGWGSLWSQNSASQVSLCIVPPEALAGVWIPSSWALRGVNINFQGCYCGPEDPYFTSGKMTKLCWILPGPSIRGGGEGLKRADNLGRYERERKKWGCTHKRLFL